MRVFLLFFNENERPCAGMSGVGGGGGVLLCFICSALTAKSCI